MDADEVPSALRRGVTAAAMTAASTARAVAGEGPDASGALGEAYADWFTARIRLAFITEWRIQMAQRAAAPLADCTQAAL